MIRCNKKMMGTITGICCILGIMTTANAREGMTKETVSVENSILQVVGNTENAQVTQLSTGGQMNTGDSGQINTGDSGQTSGNTSYTTNKVISSNPIVKTWTPTTSEEKQYYSYVGQEELAFKSSGIEKIQIGNSVQGTECQKAFYSVLGDFSIARTYNIFPLSGNLKNPVYELTQEVEITMEIPKSLQKQGRTFQMICVSENGAPTVLNDLGNSTDSITISTKYFYAFALCYKDNL